MEPLQDYNAKRNFGHTPEPEGQHSEPEERNRFVVQWHKASHEHYDFRLQLGDVLVSWAIPKKPVNDPAVRRLAIKVEDHPLSYIHFEGNIPEGNYGAGSVMVWDTGYYYLGEQKDFPVEGKVRAALARGALKLYLQGAKLKGFFNLVRDHESEKNEWFFMKIRHEGEDSGYEERSALTGRTMEEVAASDGQWDDTSQKHSSGKINPH